MIPSSGVDHSLRRKARGGGARPSPLRRSSLVLGVLAATSSSMDVRTSAFAPPRSASPWGGVGRPSVDGGGGVRDRIAARGFDPLEAIIHRSPLSPLLALYPLGRRGVLSMVVKSAPEIDPSSSSSSSSSRRASPGPSSRASGRRGKPQGGPKGKGKFTAAGDGPSSSSSTSSSKQTPHRRRRRRKKYQRKRQKPETERREERMRREMQAKYEEVRRAGEGERGGGPPSLWSFEALFPAPVWDEATIRRDLYEVGERDGKTFLNRRRQSQADGDGEGGAAVSEGSVAVGAAGGGDSKGPFAPKLDGAASEKMRRIQSAGLSSKVRKYSGLQESAPVEKPDSVSLRDEARKSQPPKPDSVSLRNQKEKAKAKAQSGGAISWGSDARQEALAGDATSASAEGENRTVVDPALTRMVEDRLYGFRRTSLGDFQYDTSLMGDGAVQFRDGVRLGNPLKINADLLTFHAKRDFSHGRLEEAEELYERAIEIDPRDGRAYLGLSRIAQRRRDFAHARECLRAGIANSPNPPLEGGAAGANGNAALVDPAGPNPYLLQALGCLEERVGNLAEAEALYVAAARSRPSHAASWVALAQLRTRKLRQGAAAGRACYRSAERELRAAGLPPSAHVYTAWAAMENKKAGDVRRARELFERALEVDPRCSAAWLQLGVMEADRENWDRARTCFESALEFDGKNSRVLQAYAIMESRRPDGDSREAIGLFERALRAKPRDAGVLQAYALYVAKLGDVDAARDLLRRGTEADKRHAAAWQAWGVLETRHGTPESARDVFQQGIWACAQSGMGGQSGGRRCARLWQAWGVLESREGDHAAARRCFSRALDADNRNVAAVTAWTSMEGDLDNFSDARAIFERALRQLPPSSEEKMTVWRAYELMEQKAGNQNAAQQVYQRSMRETITVRDDFHIPESRAAAAPPAQTQQPTAANDESVLKTSKQEVEVVRWRTGGVMGGGGEVWMNKGSIEGKVPASTMKKKNRKKRTAQRAQKQGGNK